MIGERTKRRFVLPPVLRLLLINLIEHDVGKNAAALAYYMMFAMFPGLIFLNNLVGLLDLDITAITQILYSLLPEDIVGIIETYLSYVANTSSSVLLWFSLVFSIWFPMRVAKGLMNDVRLAYRLGRPRSTVRFMIRQFLYTVVLFVVMALSLFLSAMGEQVILFFVNLLPEHVFRISAYLLELWHYLRFAVIAVLMFLGLGLLYQLALDERQPILSLLPGIAAAMLLWMVGSIVFSFYVEHFANYSLIYGALGAFIVLLLWLYMTALAMIFGAELNAALIFARPFRRRR